MKKVYSLRCHSSLTENFRLRKGMFLGSHFLVCLCFLVILSFLPLSPANAMDFTAWTDSSSNPLFGGPTSGVNRAYYPCVVKVGSVYHIWYGDGANTRHATSTHIDFAGATFPAPVVSGLVATSPYHPRVLFNASGWTIGGNFYAGPFLKCITQTVLAVTGI